jgi:hypothetical protein
MIGGEAEFGLMLERDGLSFFGGIADVGSLGISKARRPVFDQAQKGTNLIFPTILRHR